MPHSGHEPPVLLYLPIIQFYTFMVIYMPISLFVNIYCNPRRDVFNATLNQTSDGFGNIKYDLNK